MSTELVTLLIITLVAMAMSGFFSGMEIAFVSSNKVRVGIDVSKGGLSSRIIDVFFSNKDNFISSLLIGNNIVNVVYNMAKRRVRAKRVHDSAHADRYRHHHSAHNRRISA